MLWNIALLSLSIKKAPKSGLMADILNVANGPGSHGAWLRECQKGKGGDWIASRTETPLRNPPTVVFAWESGLFRGDGASEGGGTGGL